MNLKCAIVDDEPLALNLLESYVNKTPFLELTGKYRLELAVQGAQKPALVNLTLKSGTAKVTAAPVVLYAKDANTRAELKFANQEAGLNPITPVLICNSDDFSKFETDVGHAVQAGDAVIKLAK